LTTIKGGKALDKLDKDKYTLTKYQAQWSPCMGDELRS